MAKLIKLRKEESIKQLKNKLQAASANSSGINANKYCGVLTIKEDPAKFQKRIRDEWN